MSYEFESKVADYAIYIQKFIPFVQVIHGGKVIGGQVVVIGAHVVVVVIGAQVVVVVHVLQFLFLRMRLFRRA